MKNLYLFQFSILFVLLSISQTGMSQDNDSFLSISPRVGYDFPTFNNETPYVDYNGSFTAGISADTYWDWIGVGLDVDYIQTKPKNDYPLEDLYFSSGDLIADTNLSKERIDRIFFGIGPGFKYQSQNYLFVGELNFRAGIAKIEGGRTYLEEANYSTPLNFHAGYDTWTFTGKGQIRLNYFIKPDVGIHIGGYYMHHFKVEELEESGISSMFRPFTSTSGNHTVTYTILTRNQTESHDLVSGGFFAGLTFSFN